jgi:simple sugar transport system ATP-binding protein
LRGVDLTLRPGRCLGIAGVRDSGLETLELVLTGLESAEAGDVAVNGRRVRPGDPRGFRAAGAAYVPADRMKLALAPRLSLRDNLAVHALGRSRRGPPGWLDQAFLTDWAAAALREAGVPGDPRRPAGSFSGGTLQRLVVARELAEAPRLLVLAEPGWGLDRRGRAALEARLRRLVAAGAAALVLSTDIDELLGLADDLAVLRDGRIAAFFPDIAALPAAELRAEIGRTMLSSAGVVAPAGPGGTGGPGGGGL